MIQDVQDMFGEGFRRLRPRSDAEKFRDSTAAYGYESRTLNGEIWLRRAYRGGGVEVPEAIQFGPILRRGDIDDVALARFLYHYVQSIYAKGQSKHVHATMGQVQDAARAAAAESDPLLKCTLLTRALTFSAPLDIRNALVREVLPVFFDLDPGGIVLPFLHMPRMDQLCGLLRAGYALSHYSLSDLRSEDQGFPSLRLWDQVFPINFFDTLLSILQVVSYPFISLFHGGPLGLHFVFIFSKPPRHTPLLFPSTWLHDVRSDALLADERHDHVEVLRDSESPAARKLSHRRWLAEDPLDQGSVYLLTRWVLERLAIHARELSDPANFLDEDGYIDLVFALEHALSWLRVFRRTVHALGTEELPMGKFIAFDVADLIDGLSEALKKRSGTETFKLLHNPDKGLQLMESVLSALPKGPREYILRRCTDLYGDLRETILDSLWVSKKRTRSGVLVTAKDGITEREEPEGEFVANVMRALRNTHHGYMTRLDRQARPSRYLAPVTGNTPNSMASLPLIWTLGLVADPSEITGWNPLPTKVT